MQTFETLQAQLFLVFIAGVALSALLLLGIGLGKLWSHTWAWIDDCEPEENPFVNLLAKMRGWEPVGYGVWKDRKGEWQCDPYLAFFPITFAGPAVIFISLKLYPVTLTILALVATAHVARFARRNKKLFDKHLKDPEAHK